MIREFPGGALFEATSEAERFLTARGFSIGPMCGREPRGLLADRNTRIAKWRDLSRTERDRLHGQIRPGNRNSMRDGSVMVEIYDHCAEALAAFQREIPPRQMSPSELLEASYDGPIPEEAKLKGALP